MIDTLINYWVLLWQAANDNLEGTIALSALILSITQSFTSKKHNIASVRPLLCSNFGHDYDSNCFYFEVRNAGVGPAIVKEATFILGREVFNAQKIGYVLCDWVRAHHGDEIEYESYINFGIGMVLAPNEKAEIAKFRLKSGHLINQDLMRRLLGLTINVKYKSLSGNTYYWPSRDDSRQVSFISRWRVIKTFLSILIPRYHKNKKRT